MKKMAFFDTFTDTVYIDANNELVRKINALGKIKNKVKEKEQLEKELKLLEIGLAGENKIRFELEHANIGMYVLHDISLEYEGMNAQIDFVIITRAATYFVECKNLIGDITVTSEGEFRREYTYKNKKIHESMYSPYTKAKRHLDLFKKKWQKGSSKLIVKFASGIFDRFHKPLVVLANPDGLLKHRYAPREIKNVTIKVDQLVQYLEKDVENTSASDRRTSKDMKEIADMFMKINIKRDIDFTEKYTIIEDDTQTQKVLESTEIRNRDEILKERLQEFRKSRSKEKSIPAYYIFKNDELEKLVETKPKTLDELRKLKILDDVKVNCHGKEIIDIINQEC